MNSEGGYRGLVVYQKANELVISVYEATKLYPKEELFGLVSQMRRCAVSVVANIVEGYGRRTKKENINFCYISRGSLTELEYYIDLSIELGYINKETHEHLVSTKCDVGRLLSGYINSLER